MQIEEISVKNFKSFSGEHSFKFSDLRSGLHFVTGENKVEPELGANGSGKSTLFSDALHWVLYGKSPRGLRAGNIRSWSSTGGSATGIIKYVHGGTAQSLTRTWNPNSLLLTIGDDKPQTVTQEELEEHLNLSEEACKNSIIVSQFGQMFFDLQPSQKLSLISDILKLDNWEDLSKKAKNSASTLSHKISDFDKEIYRLESLIQQNKDLLYDLKRKEDQYSEEQDSKAAVLREELEEAEKSLKGNKAYLEDIEEYLKSVCTGLSQNEDSIDEARGVEKELKEKEDEIKSKRKEVGYKITSLDEELTKFLQVDEICPYCNQEVDPQHIENEKSKLEAQMAQLYSEDKKLNKSLQHIQSDLKECTDILGELIEEFNHLHSEQRECREGKYENEVNIKSLSSNIEKIKVNLNSLDNEDNPYTSQISDLENKNRQQKDDLSELRKNKEELEKQHRATEYWSKGFKEIRLFLIEEALEMLGMEVNNSLVELGLLDWNISFDIEKENKSGSIAKGFHVFIDSPSNTESVPWEAWSGGESQRLRLAGTLGLANLISNYSGIECDIQIFDEPTAHLSEEGIEDLVRILYERASNLEKKIFLIDHRSMNHGLFDSRIRVVKDEEGSRIDSIES